MIGQISLNEVAPKLRTLSEQAQSNTARSNTTTLASIGAIQLKNINNDSVASLAKALEKECKNCRKNYYGIF